MQNALTVLVLQIRRWWCALLLPSSTTAGRGDRSLATVGTLLNREVILGIMTHDTSRRREPESWKRGYYDSDVTLDWEPESADSWPCAWSGPRLRPLEQPQAQVELPLAYEPT